MNGDIIRLIGELQPGFDLASIFVQGDTAMSRGASDPHAPLELERVRTPAEDHALADACRQALAKYRAAVAAGNLAKIR
jgi:hypothetical protein